MYFNSSCTSLYLCFYIPVEAESTASVWHPVCSPLMAPWIFDEKGNCGLGDFGQWNFQMGVSKNSDTPKWMVCRENPIQMDDLRGTPIFGNTQIFTETVFCLRVFNTLVCVCVKGLPE